jgi:HAD superfamily hydrolase (TIGR01509 family)
MEDHVRPGPRTNALVSRIDAVLFDWGDTLFESPHAPSVILEYARARKIPIDNETAEQMWRELWEAGKTPEEHAKGRDLSRAAHKQVWMALFQRANARLPGVDEVLYERVMNASIWKPYPDTASTLRSLRSREIRIGVASNHAFDLRPFFREFGLADYIDAYALSYEIGVAKPARRLFTEACRMLRVEPANALMVGDDPVSDGGAAAAGLQMYILPAYAHGGKRGLERVLQIVDSSRR